MIALAAAVLVWFGAVLTWRSFQALTLEVQQLREQMVSPKSWPFGIAGPSRCSPVCRTHQAALWSQHIDDQLARLQSAFEVSQTRLMHSSLIRHCVPPPAPGCASPASHTPVISVHLGLCSAFDGYATSTLESPPSAQHLRHFTTPAALPKLAHSGQQGMQPPTQQTQPTSVASSTEAASALDTSRPKTCRDTQLYGAHHRYIGLDGGLDYFGGAMKERNPHGQPKMDDLIVEVGAGDGRLAVRAASKGFRVISVEASKTNIATMLSRLANTTRDFKNKLGQHVSLPGNLTVMNYAVSKESGETTFWEFSGMGRILSEGGGEADVNNPRWKKQGKKIHVDVRPLDELITERPWVLKVDVEGNELGVFQGARRLLSTMPPKAMPPFCTATRYTQIVIIEFNPVMMEWSAHTDAVDLLELLHEHGYQALPNFIACHWYTLFDSKISEPGHKGFLANHGSWDRPRDFQDYVDYLMKSKKYDWWGSWCDIIGILHWDFDPTSAYSST
eukprot:gene5847-1043_t